jgi:hypothetical protein
VVIAPAIELPPPAAGEAARQLGAPPAPGSAGTLE